MANTEFRKNVLGMYKKMLLLAKSMTEPKKSETILQIRDQFRKNSIQDDSNQIADLLKKAQSSFSFLKMISPKVKQSGQSGVTTVTFGSSEGKSVRKVLVLIYIYDLFGIILQ
jgi:vacuolar-type H+-ATPase catalytic subunit A/Vma1